MTQFLQTRDPIIQDILLNAQQFERKVYIIEEFDRESIFKVIRAIEKIVEVDSFDEIKPEDAEPIWLMLDSYGGCLHSCFGLISTIRRFQKIGYKFYTVDMARSMSASFYVAMTGDKRFAYELSSLMVHDQRAFEYGYKTVRDKRVELKEWEKEWNILIELVEEYTLITREQLEWYVERGLDWNMTSQEAIELGVIDEIL